MEENTPEGLSILNDHGRRISALEAQMSKMSEDINLLKTQSTSLMSQVTTVVGQISSLTSIITSSNHNNQKIMTQMVERSEEKIEKRMEPIQDILSVVRVTKNILIGISAIGSTILIFLATYGNKLFEALEQLKTLLGH